ncbi:MAG: hypothetical protein Athens071416_122 [Parcubacteria group bacterium Athens0714_16]|nr:MAG: hypothetical protein Athens071416_122 [Parcubacteria group bacterium Athens0714_16]
MSEKNGTTPNEIGKFAETLRAIIPATSRAIKLLQCYENFSINDLNKILSQNGEILAEEIFSLFKSMMKSEIKYPSWLNAILESEKKAHLAFFGKEFDLTQFAENLQKYGKKKIQYWKSLMLEPHFIPKMAFMPKNNYPGWKIKPNDWFYENVTAGKILHNINGNLITLKIVETDGVTLLIDTRCKPQYTSGSQMYENDNFLSSVILKLRKEEKIKYDSNIPWESRFNISADEFETQLKPHVADLLDLKIKQIRFEKTIEANVIPQMYQHMPRKNDGNTNTWCRYDEFFGHLTICLFGGNSTNGGLSHVSCGNSDSHWGDGSVRSVAVL